MQSRRMRTARRADKAIHPVHRPCMSPARCHGSDESRSGSSGQSASFRGDTEGSCVGFMRLQLKGQLRQAPLPLWSHFASKIDFTRRISVAMSGTLLWCPVCCTFGAERSLAPPALPSCHKWGPLRRRFSGPVTACTVRDQDRRVQPVSEASLACMRFTARIRWPPFACVHTMPHEAP